MRFSIFAFLPNFPSILDTRIPYKSWLWLSSIYCAITVCSKNTAILIDIQLLLRYLRMQTQTLRLYFLMPNYYFRPEDGGLPLSYFNSVFRLLHKTGLYVTLCISARKNNNNNNKRFINKVINNKGNGYKHSRALYKFTFPLLP